MVLPVAQHAGQQVRTFQKRALGWFSTTQGDMIAATGTGMLAIQHEFFRPQTALTGLLIKNTVIVYQFLPGSSGMDIDFDNARIRCNHEFLQTGIAWRFIAFNDYR